MLHEFQEYKGIVVERRDLGGIVFLKVVSGSYHFNAIIRKGDSKKGIFTQVRAIRKRDFVHIRCSVQGEENIIVEVLSVLKPSLNGDNDDVHKYMLLLSMNCLFKNVRRYLDEKGYVEVRLPTIHFGIGRGHSFYIDFFGHQGRLSSSNALFLGVAAGHLGRCFSLQRVFRAEPSATSKHLAEFDMLELAILGSPINECMDELENLINWLLNAEWPASIISPIHALRRQINLPFRRIPYSDIEKHYNLNSGGLGAHERSIASNGPTFIVNFPQGIASWAARKLDERLTYSFNLLLPEVGEVAEGSERDTDVDTLRERFSKWNMERQLGWYSDGIRYPNSTLSVAGLGLERLAMWLFNLKNIRETVLFYRDKTFSEMKECKRQNNRTIERAGNCRLVRD